MRTDSFYASNLFGRSRAWADSASVGAALSIPPTLMRVLMLALIFVLGWPLQWVPIVMIVVPVVRAVGPASF